VNAAELLHDLEARGVRVREREGAVVLAPAKLARPADLNALRAHKAAVLLILRTRALGTDWSRVSLQELDRVLEVAVPWSDLSLILAPGCRVARELRDRDPKPGRVWCVCEVIDLLLAAVTPGDARTIAEAKLDFAGSVTHAGEAPDRAPGSGRQP
jgi:hypothetical protein